MFVKENLDRVFLKKTTQKWVCTRIYNINFHYTPNFKINSKNPLLGYFWSKIFSEKIALSCTISYGF